MYVPAVCTAIRKLHHSWREMRNGKQGNKTAMLGYYDTSVKLYIIQDNTVYLLCKVAQVFSARGSRPILCITLLSGRESMCTCTLYFIDLLLVLVILLELPHLAYISASAASVMHVLV